MTAFPSVTSKSIAFAGRTVSVRKTRPVDSPASEEDTVELRRPEQPETALSPERPKRTRFQNIKDRLVVYAKHQMLKKALFWGAIGGAIGALPGGILAIPGAIVFAKTAVLCDVLARALESLIRDPNGDAMRVKLELEGITEITEDSPLVAMGVAQRGEDGKYKVPGFQAAITAYRKAQDKAAAAVKKTDGKG
jgi:hypothetical protein